MSERTRLATGPIGDMQALGAFGRPVHSLYAQLRAVVRARLSDRHAALFAEPVLHSADNRIDWYTDTAGAPPVRLADLPPEQAQAAAATLQQLTADLQALSAELSASTADSDQALGHLIGLALSTPGDGHVHVVGDQPVLAFWGFRSGGGVRTTPLHGYGGEATRPAAAAAPVAAVAVARGSPLPWVMWGVTGLLLLIAALLLLRAAGGVDVPGLAWLDRPAAQAAPSPGGETAEPTPVADRTEPAVDDSALVAAREREQALRAQLAGLESQFDAARAACPAPATPPRVATVPDRDPPPRPPVVDTDRDGTVVRPDRIVPLPGREPDPLASLDGIDPADDPLDADPGTEDPLAEDPPAEEPPAEEAPEEETVDGAPLTIDRAARDALDLAPLEGDWRTGESLMDQTSEAPLEIEYSFDAEGNGTSTIRLADGTTCTARAEAAYNGPDALVIRDLDYPVCTDGTEFEKSEIVCLIDADGSTICEGAQPGGSAFAIGLYEAD